MNSARQQIPLFADGSPVRLAVLAVVVGLVSGFGAVVFRGLIALFHNLLFFGQFSLSYDTSLHTDPSSWGAGVILVPMLGAVVVAYLVKTFAPEAKGKRRDPAGGLRRQVAGVIDIHRFGRCDWSGGADYSDWCRFWSHARSVVALV